MPFSLPAQRVDRIERSRLPGRIPAEADADDRADDQAGGRPSPRKDHGDVEPQRYAVAAGDPEKNARETSDLRQHDRFEEKLLDDVILARADRFAHANLARSLGDA